LEKGNSDPAFRTKPQIAAELVKRAREASIPFRAVVADCLYGENPDFQGALWRRSVPYVLSLRPHKVRWAEGKAAHTPEEATQRMVWNSEEDPGAWKSIVRTFTDGHTEEWWAAEVTTLIGYDSRGVISPGGGEHQPTSTADQQYVVLAHEPACSGLPACYHLDSTKLAFF
jgi:hypothetical protein